VASDDRCPMNWKEDNEKLQTQFPVSRPRFKLNISKIQVYSVIVRQACPIVLQIHVHVQEICLIKSQRNNTLRAKNYIHE
jgi:hypothetical protein